MNDLFKYYYGDYDYFDVDVSQLDAHTIEEMKKMTLVFDRKLVEEFIENGNYVQYIGSLIGNNGIYDFQSKIELLRKLLSRKIENNIDKALFK